MSHVNFRKIADTDFSEGEVNAVEKGPNRDLEIIQRDIELEQAAIDEYQGQLADASPKLKEILEHLIEEEKEHRAELEEIKLNFTDIGE